MEIAIPVVALGAMYIISNQKKKKPVKKNEGFERHGSNRKKPSGELIEKNFPVEDTTQQRYARDLNYYTGATDNTEMPKYNPGSAVASGNDQKFQSLTGESMNPEELTHNNEVPFFGSTVTQSTKGYEGLLDSYTGAGSQTIQKEESAPLFKPKKDMNWTNGMPSTTQYMQDRIRSNLTSKMNNTKPWEEVRVGPGLNDGFSRNGKGGFNSGMEAREKWLPKNVDQLRVKTNPKNTYERQLLGAHVGKRGPRGEIGKVEKNRPDTFYIQGSDRWFTTTGAEKAQTTRSENILRDVNRLTTNKEHFGVMASENNGIYQKGKFQDSTRQQLSGPTKHLGGATVPNGWNPSSKDYGKGGYTTLTNSRSLTTEKSRLGNAYRRDLTALAAPILDVLKPTRKQNVVGSMRPTGNVESGVTKKHPIWNPNDQPRTTIKEQTENTIHTKHGGWAIDAGHTTNPHQPVYGQRDTTTCPALGNPSATESTGVKMRLYNSAYSANLNHEKEKICKVDRFHIGNTNKFNSNVNYAYYKHKATNSSVRNPEFPKSSSGARVLGAFSSKNTRETNVQYGRQGGDLLNAFKNNPYTHSLTNVV